MQVITLDTSIPPRQQEVLYAMLDLQFETPERVSYLTNPDNRTEVVRSILYETVKGWEDYNPYGPRGSYKLEWMSNQWEQPQDIYFTLREVALKRSPHGHEIRENLQKVANEIGLDQSVQNRLMVKDCSDCGSSATCTCLYRIIDRETGDSALVQGLAEGSAVARQFLQSKVLNKKITEVQHLSESHKQMREREVSPLMLEGQDFSIIDYPIPKEGEYEMNLNQEYTLFTYPSIVQGFVQEVGGKIVPWKCAKGTCRRPLASSTHIKIGCWGASCGSHYAPPSFLLLSYITDTVLIKLPVPGSKKSRRSAIRIKGQNAGRFCKGSYSGTRASIRVWLRSLEMHLYAPTELALPIGWQTHRDRMTSLQQANTPCLPDSRPSKRWKEISKYIAKRYDEVWDLGGGGGEIGSFIANKVGAKYYNLEKGVPFPPASARKVLIMAFQSLHHMENLDSYYSLVSQALGELTIIVREHDYVADRRLDLALEWVHKAYGDDSLTYYRPKEAYLIPGFTWDVNRPMSRLRNVYLVTSRTLGRSKT